MARNQTLLLLAFAVLGGVLVMVEVARRADQGVDVPPAAGSADTSGEPRSGDAVGASASAKARAKRIEERMGRLGPRRDAAGRPDLETGEPRGDADDRVILEIVEGGAVRFDGTTYAIAHEDPAQRAAAGDALRAALLKVHEARGGDALREPDGRTGLELTLRGAGALEPDTLKRLIDVCGQEPLRAYRFQFDLGDR